MKPENEGIPVLKDALIGKHLEDLLQRCLTDTVLLDAEVLLLVLDLSEEPSDSLVLLRHSELVEVTTLLKHLDLAEDLSEVAECAESESLGVEECNQVKNLDFIVVLHPRLEDQV